MPKVWKTIKFFIKTALGVFVLSLVVVVSVPRYERDIQHADAIIILGAAINTPALYNRTLEGLRMYQAGKADVLVLSGGRISDKDISEAQYMQKVILANSSTTPPMILEQDSHSTYDNIVNSKKLIPNAKSVIIVSDTYHLARGAALAKSLGFSPVYWSAPDSGSYYPKDELIYHYLREALALISYLPKFLFG